MNMPILPKDAYTSRAWFEREQEHIFSNTWAFAGLVEDLSEPGQYITVQAGLNNILVVMSSERDLRAYHNICRHRGTQLLRSTGRTKKVITCPYHDWTYDLEGRLLTVPEEKAEFSNLDKTCLSLKSASVATWRGMLWVHPEPGADSVESWFKDIEPHLGPHRPDELVEYESARTEHEINANWKIVVENYIDGYHLKHLHSGTLGMYDHSKIISKFYGPHFAFWEPLSANYAKDIEAHAPLPLIDHIPKSKMGAWVPMLFPGIGLGESESSWSTFHIVPVAPDKTIVRTRTKIMDVSTLQVTMQTLRSSSYWAKHVRGKFDTGDPTDPMASGDFMAEDIFACEQQQKSLKSPYFEHGPSSKLGEAPVLRHQEIILDWLESLKS